MPAADRKVIFDQVFGKDCSREVYEEHEKCIDALPIVKLDMEMVVEGEEDILIGDLMSCKIKVTFPKL